MLVRSSNGFRRIWARARRRRALCGEQVCGERVCMCGESGLGASLLDGESVTCPRILRRACGVTNAPCLVCVCARVCGGGWGGRRGGRVWRAEAAAAGAQGMRVRIWVHIHTCSLKKERWSHVTLLRSKRSINDLNSN